MPPSADLTAKHGFDLSPGEAALLRGQLPPEARSWLRTVLGRAARIVSVHPRAGGTSSAVHAVTVDAAAGPRRHLILRRYVRADWLAREPDLAAHEARVLSLLESSTVAAPLLVAVDATGEAADVPSVLMTRIPGRVRWSPRTIDGYLRHLATAMVAVHRVDVPDGISIRPYSKYYETVDLEPPPGTSCRDAWLRAIELHAGPAPSNETTFIHRDFHPGNVLWAGDSVSGVVDWVNASVGAPDADVGHCRLNLARHLGVDVADRFSTIARERSGRGEYDPYWDLVAAVGMLGDDGAARAQAPALDEFVSRAVARLGATR